MDTDLNEAKPMGNPAEAVRATDGGAQHTQAATQPALPLDVVNRRAAPSGAVRRQTSVFGYAWLVPAVMIITMVGGVIGLYFQPPGLRLVMSVLGLEPGAGTKNPIAVPVERAAANATTASTGVSAVPTVAGIGKLLPQGDVITIAPPYGAGDARISTLKVREGDNVSAGDLLAVLDNERTLQAAAEAALATVAAREAVLRQTRESVAASREEAKASLGRAEAAVVNTRRDLDRVTELRARSFATDASYDQKRAIHDQAAQDVERAKATLSRFSLDAASQQADILVAERNLDSARAELVRAQSNLERAHVRAPVNGTVLTVHVRPGEKPGAKGILNFGNLDDMTAEIEVYQT